MVKLLTPRLLFARGSFGFMSQCVSTLTHKMFFVNKSQFPSALTHRLPHQKPVTSPTVAGRQQG
jgi:hypothetical protein